VCPENNFSKEGEVTQATSLPSGTAENIFTQFLREIQKRGQEWINVAAGHTPIPRVDTQLYWEKRRVQQLLRRVLEDTGSANLGVVFDPISTCPGKGQQWRGTNIKSWCEAPARDYVDEEWFFVAMWRVALTPPMVFLLLLLIVLFYLSQAHRSSFTMRRVDMTPPNGPFLLDGRNSCHPHSLFSPLAQA